jgi:predicted GIY-YIG superfamily endonuclease
MVIRNGRQVIFHVYMLRCADGSIYTGHTDNLTARFYAHQDGRFRGYTSTRRPVKLIFAEDFNTRVEALEAEMRIKRWVRRKKLALVRRDWNELRRLARGRDRQ